VRAIQAQTAEVTATMAAGSAQMDQSAALGEQAQDAVRCILSAVEQTTEQAAALRQALDAVAADAHAVRAAGVRAHDVSLQMEEALAAQRSQAQQARTAIEDLVAASEQAAARAACAVTQESLPDVADLRAGADELAALAACLREACSALMPGA
jgi:hypothetical protein